MNIAVFEKVNMLPLDKQQEIQDFIEYLLSKYSVNETESIAEKRKKNLGRLKDEIWVADDFNNTPDDFKDYI